MTTTPLLDALALSIADVRERSTVPGDWYVLLPSRYERQSAEVVAAYVRMRDDRTMCPWPPGLVGVEFAAGRRDPRPPALRRATFPPPAARP